MKKCYYIYKKYNKTCEKIRKYENKDNQTKFEIKIYECERLNSKENKLLGKLKINIHNIKFFSNISFNLFNYLSK